MSSRERSSWQSLIRLLRHFIPRNDDDVWVAICKGELLSPRRTGILQLEIRMGKILEARVDGSAILKLEGPELQAFKIFRRMRRGIVIKDGNIFPGEKKSRYSVPFEQGLEVAVWVSDDSGRIHIHRFTTKAQYNAALTELNR